MALCLSCGGGSGPGPSNPPSGGTPSPTPTPTPTPAPPAAQSCQLGNGDYLAQCERRSPEFIDAVFASIDKIVAEQPEIFDLERTNGPGSFFVKDSDAYFEGVVSNLVDSGFCSQSDQGFLLLKNTNEFSETYDILVSDGFIRRGDGSYRLTCNPASFPVDPQEVINRIRVSFFDMRCPDGVTPPRLNEDKLPVSCMGTVTATPKDIHEDDVPAHIHGPDIEWSLEQDARYVRVDDIHAVPFNKNLAGIEPGPFVLCATVQEIQGCMRGEVIP